MRDACIAFIEFDLCEKKTHLLLNCIMYIKIVLLYQIDNLSLYPSSVHPSIHPIFLPFQIGFLSTTQNVLNVAENGNIVQSNVNKTGVLVVAPLVKNLT